MRLHKFFHLLGVVAVGGTLLFATHVVLWLMTNPTGRLHQFIYDRGPVQHAILAVATLVIAVLLDRFGRCCLRYVPQPNETTRRDLPETLVHRLEAAGRILHDRGASATRAQIEQWSEEGSVRVRRAYETINGLTGLLPALGLIGTMLGLSGALFGAFSGGELTDQAVGNFVKSLSTAMDTTVLGMLFSVPLFGCVFFLSRRENDINEREAKYLLWRMGVEGADAEPGPADVVQAELRRMTRQLAVEAEVAFGKILENATEALHEHLGAAVSDVLAAQQEQNDQMVGKLAEDVADRLGQSVEDMGRMMERHNGQLAEDVVQQFARLERALQNRTPEEVLIKYQNNGRVNGSSVRNRSRNGSTNGRLVKQTD